MLAKVISSAVLGIDAYPVEVEVDVASRGLPFFSTVGLPDAAVKESKERVRAALSKRAGDVELVTSHVVRQVLERGLDSLERELGRK